MAFSFFPKTAKTCRLIMSANEKKYRDHEGEKVKPRLIEYNSCQHIGFYSFFKKKGFSSTKLSTMVFFNAFCIYMFNALIGLCWLFLNMILKAKKTIECLGNDKNNFHKMPPPPNLCKKISVKHMIENKKFWVNLIKLT